ncbi:YjeF family domain-containing protein [Aphanomyces invadans]|uniref:ATP-dependent (S)-NAD(P)H-hydrate dehydratase n=1 Tax=Aphanomyces invadans TaxID=157072 RepID=A0A024UGU5_9STRA|nr:YjeF family domain-containing protein [Aphanomyces invadans]ETW05499.1 YjeF family domain-containing protein [Aphanomyces invadans]|eukprot:XP_008865276.1 YjeF family domain-containing protein [Aphanomyces invadans]
MDPSELIPPLTCEAYKGQHGKVGIVGGCAEYTGAPYYAGMAALKTGVDLCHIFCTPEAGIPIKCYSPELIVHPYLGMSTNDRILAVLPRLDALILGPGLGRDPNVLNATKSILTAATELRLPLVLDGDALYLLATDVTLLRNYSNAILTPNAMEYGRLCVALGLTDALDVTGAASISAHDVAAALGHVTVLQKGAVDTISDGYSSSTQDRFPMYRRCGGQGDVHVPSSQRRAHARCALGPGGMRWCVSRVGCQSWVRQDLIDFLTWFSYSVVHPSKRKTAPRPLPSMLRLAAYGGSLVTRKSASIAFDRHGRATTTPDILASIHDGFDGLFKT